MRSNGDIDKKGKPKFYLNFVGAFSAAGGRATIMAFEKKKQ